MQSTAKVVMVLNCSAAANTKARGRRALQQAGMQVPSGVVLGLQHLAAAVETGRADVVAQVRFARGGLDGDARRGHGVVRTVHAALGRRLLVLLDGHEGLLDLAGPAAW